MDHLAAEPPPIDYDRRRRLDYRDLLPHDLWDEICRRTGTPPGAGQKADFARCLLFERLSGLPASRSPFLAAGYDVRAKLSEFPRALTPALAAPLAEAARQFLDDQGLGEEPVYWHPPLHLLDGLLLPGPDPGAVDLAALHDLTRREHAALRRSRGNWAPPSTWCATSSRSTPRPHRPLPHSGSVDARPRPRPRRR
ncbi:MAG: hypothetical protein WAW17_28860 [Rhodococcus sp. (in: high G+C Gram-positive bacteria)]|uniref:hypothetical protein n=1 Tax=Rhodococcus sp. TaxID=1831 RepID=UPI003BB17CAC